MIDETGSMEDRRIEARQSFTGRSLTEGQFDEAWALAGIVAREIYKSGTFRDKLSDYAHAFARNERFDTLRGEEIVRDIFKARYGQSLNQMRETLMRRETEIPPSVGPEALRHARSVAELIRNPPTMPFYRAYDRAAVALAEEHGITEATAKEIMQAAFVAHEDRELYEAGKEAEELYHKPARRETADADKPENRFRRQKNWSRS